MLARAQRWREKEQELTSVQSLSRLRLFATPWTFCHKGGVICISEVIDISPGNRDPSLCLLQPSISHDVLCIWNWL